MSDINLTDREEKLRFTKADLAEAFQLSRDTITKMLGNTSPHGRRKNATVYHIGEVATMNDVRRPYIPQQPDEEMLISDPNKMPPKMRLTHFQAVDAEQAALMKQRKNMIEDRMLIPAFEVEQVLAQAFKPIALFLDTLPDALERDGMIASSDVEALISMIDSGREQLAEHLAQLSPEVRDVNASGEWE